jgi:hypothetical protein
MEGEPDAGANRKGEGDEQRQHHQKEAGLHSEIFRAEFRGTRACCAGLSGVRVSRGWTHNQLQSNSA